MGMRPDSAWLVAGVLCGAPCCQLSVTNEAKAKATTKRRGMQMSHTPVDAAYG